MKSTVFLASAAALLALAGCNKKVSQDQGGTADTSTVKITQSTPPAGGNWTDVVNETSGGGYLMGDPNAKTKVLEIASLGCPYCKRFEDEGAPHLLDLVKAGKINWEFRPYLIHGPIDMAANLIAKCNGPKTFFPLAFAMYKDQESWMGKLEAAPQSQLEQMSNLPTNQIFKAYANLAGLQDFAAARGLPKAKSDQCLANQQMIDREVQITSNVNQDYPDFKGTPSFVLNGKLLPDAGEWAKLKPLLEETLK